MKVNQHFVHDAQLFPIEWSRTRFGFAATIIAVASMIAPREAISQQPTAGKESAGGNSVAAHIVDIPDITAFTFANGPEAHERLFGSPGIENPTGDTYTAAALAQDGVSAFYIHAGAPATTTFNGAALSLGANQAQASGGTLSIIEAYVPTGPTTAVVITEITALSAGGAPQPIVAAGVSGPNGAFTSWRMDVGSNAGGTNKITPNVPWTVASSEFTVFNSAGAPLATFPLSLDSSDATGLSGTAVVGIGGANIAGFDLASIQVRWNLDGIEQPPSSTVAFGLPHTPLGQATLAIDPLTGNLIVGNIGASGSDGMLINLPKPDDGIDIDLPDEGPCGRFVLLLPGDKLALEVGSIEVGNHPKTYTSLQFGRIFQSIGRLPGDIVLKAYWQSLVNTDDQLTVVIRDGGALLSLDHIRGERFS